MFLIKNNEALLIAPNLLIFPNFFFHVILSIGNKFIYIFMIYYLFTFTGLWFTKSSIMYQNKISWNLNPYTQLHSIKKNKFYFNIHGGKWGKFYIKKVSTNVSISINLLYNSSFNRMILLIFWKIDRCWKFKFLKYCYLD